MKVLILLSVFSLASCSSVSNSNISMSSPNTGIAGASLLMNIPAWHSEMEARENRIKQCLIDKTCTSTYDQFKKAYIIRYVEQKPKVEVADEMVVVAAPVLLMAMVPPDTVSLSEGAVVPMPTLPEDKIRIHSVPAV